MASSIQYFNKNQFPNDQNIRVKTPEGKTITVSKSNFEQLKNLATLSHRLASVSYEEGEQGQTAVFTLDQRITPAEKAKILAMFKELGIEPQ